jgi:hypothetical protein
MPLILAASLVGGVAILVCAVVPIYREESANIATMSLFSFGFYLALFGALHLLAYAIGGRV